MGSGDRICHPCGGTGQENCATCGAQGWLYRYQRLHARLQSGQQSDFGGLDPALAAVLQGLSSEQLWPCCRFSEGMGELSDNLLRRHFRADVVVAVAEVTPGTTLATAPLTIRGFGPEARIFDFQGLAQALVADDLAALRVEVERWQWCKPMAADGLRGAFAQVMASEVNQAVLQPGKPSAGGLAGTVSSAYAADLRSTAGAAVTRLLASSTLRPLAGVGAVVLAASALLPWLLASDGSRLGAAFSMAMAGWAITRTLALRDARVRLQAVEGRTDAERAAAIGALVHHPSRRRGEVVLGAVIALAASAPWALVRAGL
jgi:hypothetical protein